jgi:hypothetical protein
LAIAIHGNIITIFESLKTLGIMLQMVLSFCLITLPIFIFDKANAQATVQMPLGQRQIGQLSRFAEFYFLIPGEVVFRLTQQLPPTSKYPSYHPM